MIRASPAELSMWPCKIILTSKSRDARTRDSTSKHEMKVGLQEWRWFLISQSCKQKTYIYRERERERFCNCDAKWLEHSQRCSGCDSAKIFLTSKSRDTKKGSWKWASGATMMILICHALMQVSFRWVGTNFKDERASKTWRRPSLWRKPHSVRWFLTWPLAHHPLDTHYYSVVDEPQLPHLSLYLVSYA